MARLVGLGGALILLVADLDARYEWSGVDFGLTEEIIAPVLILAGFAFSAWVRHPGYAGALLTYWVTPLLLDFLWTFVPVVFMTIVLLIRTDLEDRTLRHELSGYKEYATQKSHYRLLPWIW